MNCPRCNIKLGEDDVCCPKCGLNLMNWFMKDNFGDVSKEESQKDQKSVSEKREDDGNDSLDEIQNDSQNGFMDSFSNDPYIDPYKDPYGGSNQDPYGGLNYDPYEGLNQNPYGKQKKESEHSIYGEQNHGLNGGADYNNFGNDFTVDPYAKTDDEKKGKKKVKNNSSDTKKSKKGIILVLLLIIIGLGAGYGLGSGKLNQLYNVLIDMKSQLAKGPELSSEASKDEEISESTDASISEATATPTLEPTATPTPEPTATPTPEPVLSWDGEVSRESQDSVMDAGTWLDKNHMTSLMDASGARYGLYVMDLTNYTYYSIGEAEVPLPASALIGIPIMYTIAEGITNNTYSMDDPVRFTYTFENGRGNMKSNQNGQYFALGDMLKEALLYSDNNALNSLIDYLTLDRINEICHQYGFDSVDMQRKLMTESTSLENYVSPKDAAMMLNAIYQNNFKEIDRTFLMNYYKLVPGDTANKGMYPACGNCDVFLNLNGITASRYNEVGLVENGEEVFIMAVMTVDGKNETSAPCVTNEASYVLANLKVGER